MKRKSINPAKHRFDIKGRTAEAMVHQLAEKTFLVDWCFPNPVLPDGKELCDLLVVFDEVVIICQVKDLKLGKHGIQKQSGVERNLRQLSGARRQLLDLNTPISLRNARRTIKQFDPSGIKEAFLLSILLGEDEDFFSGIELFRKSTIHVFNRSFTETVLQELDTVSDFINYLRSKETLIRDGKSFMIMGGEEELLAFYLMNDRSFSRIEKATHVVLIEGSWSEFRKSAAYLSKKDEDKYSYGWDSIIDRAHEGSSEYELVARELARPTRFQRRFLGKCFLDAWMIASDDKVHDAYRRIILSEGITYCFIFCGGRVPKEERIAMLQIVCYVARGVFKENQKVLGIATEKPISSTCSYDYCLLEFPAWSETNEKEVAKLRKQFGILDSPTVARVEEVEYPASK
jgi:hypothetical protein